MNKKPLISVIIPVYDVEKYLDKCVTSVVNQKYRNLEIILVDDGSPDESGKLCDKWANKDSRITVIHQSNKGLSGARNTGMKAATGKYIYFLDSDDYISDNLFAIVIPMMEEKDLDCVGFASEVLMGNVRSQLYPNCKKTDLGVMLKGGEYVKTDIPLSLVPLYVFRLGFLKDKKLTFKEHIYYEDMLFTPTFMLEDPRIVLLNSKFYFYMKRDNSITTSNLCEKNYTDMCDITNYFWNLLKDNDCNVIAVQNILKTYLIVTEQRYRRLSKQDQKKLRCKRAQLLSAVGKNKKISGAKAYWISKYMLLVYIMYEVKHFGHI